ncbi:MAG: hypothetical protein JSW48_12890 [Betaproteobacteria bacterium]|nr:MAG: hypothetical protein JSW48_12890 [Betaproteobacteria bacterium]
MKRLILCLLLVGLAASANAYHSGVSETTTADENASCNAAFHAGCPTDADHEEQTHTASSSGFAAPAGDLGSSTFETAVIAFLVFAVVRVRMRQPGSIRCRPDRSG